MLGQEKMRAVKQEKILLLMAKTKSGIDCYYYIVPHPVFGHMIRPTEQVTDISRLGKIIRSGYGLPGKKVRDSIFEEFGFDSMPYLEAHLAEAEAY